MPMRTLRFAPLLVLIACGPRPKVARAADSVDRQPASVAATTSPSLPRGAIATDSTIQIVLPSGDTVAFIDSTVEDDQSITYSFQGHLKALPFYLIRVQYYETSGVLLVHDSTGREIRLRNDPVISPDGREIVIAHHAWTAESGDSKLEVWTVSGDSLIVEFRWEQPIEYAWGPKEARWRNQDTIDVIKEMPTGYRQDMTEVPGYIARVNGVWITDGLLGPGDSVKTHSRSTP